MKKKVAFTVQVPVSVFKEGKTFIAYSPVLDLSTSAGTFEKVQKRFAEIVSIFIEELMDMGTIKEVLTDLGWKRKANQWLPPIQITHDIAEISVPLN